MRICLVMLVSLLFVSCGNLFYNSEWTVGDYGPAGGIVYYDKGCYSDGWRYMEVASGDEYSSIWATVYDYSINKNVNGFADWYIPTIDDLLRINAAFPNNGLEMRVDKAYWSATDGTAGSGYKKCFNFESATEVELGVDVETMLRTVRRF